uniref:Uncharacterized protein n=1 Tax=Lepeophtheirus salmonis TaxID=72036 RepID=A0A0K2U764_LEPSM
MLTDWNKCSRLFIPLSGRKKSFGRASLMIRLLLLMLCRLLLLNLLLLYCLLLRLLSLLHSGRSCEKDLMLPIG